MSLANEKERLFRTLAQMAVVSSVTLIAGIVLTIFGGTGNLRGSGWFCVVVAILNLILLLCARASLKRLWAEALTRITTAKYHQ